MPSTPPSVGRYAYQSSAKRLLTFVTIVLLAMGAIAMLVTAVELALFPGETGVDYIVVSIFAGSSVACVIGSVTLIPFFQRPVDVPAGATMLEGSAPLFVVRFRRTTTGSPSYQGNGVLCCYPDHVIVEGSLAHNHYLLLGVVIASLVAAMVEPGIGVGIIVGSGIAGVMGREKHIQVIPYQTIWRFTVAGTQATMACPQSRPAHIVFEFAAADAERLHDAITIHMLAAEPQVSPPVY